MKGITNNPNGRPKGKPNRTTTELREMITTLFESKYEDFTNALDELEAKEKVDAYIKIMSFVIPKKTETKFDFSSLTDIELDNIINKLKSDNE